MAIRVISAILAILSITFVGCRQANDSSGNRSRTVAYRQPADSNAELPTAPKSDPGVQSYADVVDRVAPAVVTKVKMSL